MAGISPDSLINYADGLSLSKFSFSAPKKLSAGIKGVVVNVFYDGQQLILKTPPLITPFGTSTGFKGAGGKAPSENESNKTTIDLDVPNAETCTAFKRALLTVDEAFANYVASEAPLIFGEAGLGLKSKDMENKLREITSGTLKVYTCLRSSDEKYAPKIKLTFPQSGAKVINTKGGKPMEAADIARGNQVTAVFRIKGLFVSPMMVTTQMEAALVAVRGAAAVDATAIFADIIEVDDEPEPEVGAKRKAEAVAGTGVFDDDLEF